MFGSAIAFHSVSVLFQVSFLGVSLMLVSWSNTAFPVTCLLSLHVTYHSRFKQQTKQVKETLLSLKVQHNRRLSQQICEVSGKITPNKITSHSSQKSKLVSQKNRKFLFIHHHPVNRHIFFHETEPGYDIMDTE